MARYRFRFNTRKGEPGRGTTEHAWRFFDGQKEYLAKAVVLKVPAWTEREPGTDQWNVACEGFMVIHRSTATIEVLPMQV